MKKKNMEMKILKYISKKENIYFIYIIFLLTKNLVKEILLRFIVTIFLLFLDLLQLIQEIFPEERVKT